MAYLSAALRTLVILVGIVLGLFAMVVLFTCIIGAFALSFVGGFAALAVVLGVGALFGTQLKRSAETERVKSIACWAQIGFGWAALLCASLGAIVVYETYLWNSAHPAYLSLVKSYLGIDPPSNWITELVSGFVFLDIINGVGVVLPILVATGLWKFVGRTWATT
jgi:hypothetical protein